MREFFSKRITDGVLNRLVLGWLKAGTVQDGRWRASEEGTPQGGNVSALLAYLYLHEVLDDWFTTEVQPRLSFLGFTFYWGKSRNGKPVIKLKTVSKRKNAKKTALTKWIKANRHLPRTEQHRIQSAKLRGLYYY